MKKVNIILIIFSFIVSMFIQMPTSTYAGIVIEKIRIPFPVYRLHINGNEIYLLGKEHQSDPVVGEGDFVALGYGTVLGFDISLQGTWIPNDTNERTYAMFVDEHAYSVILKHSDKIFVGGSQSPLYIWNLETNRLKNNFDVSILDAGVKGDKIYATSALSESVGRIDPETGAFYDLTSEQIQNLFAKHDYEYPIAADIVFPYKDYIVSAGLNFLLFFKETGDGLKIDKYYLGDTDKTEGLYDVEFRTQDAYAIWNNYLILPHDPANLHVINLDNEDDSFTWKIPRTVPMLVTDGNFVYGATRDGKVYAFNIIADRKRVGLVWQLDLGKEIYSIAAKDGMVYVATGEKDLTVIKVPIQYSDVSEDYWAYDAIRYLSIQGVLSGYPDGTFKPDKSVTRAEFAKMLAVALELDIYCDDTLPEIWRDVHAGDWYCSYITPVVKAGYMKGYGNGYFGPNKTVKKEEIITTIVRIKGWQLINPDTPTFPDVPRDHWSYQYIETGVKHGLVSKYDEHITDGKFHLSVPATRSQTAVFVYRMMTK